jgi:hypothetical protein
MSIPETRGFKFVCLVFEAESETFPVKPPGYREEGWGGTKSEGRRKEREGGGGRGKALKR